MITDVTSKVDLPASAGHGSEWNDAEATRLPPDGKPTTVGRTVTPPSDPTTLEQALEAARQIIQESDSHLQIEFDPDLQRVIIKVLSGDSGEVIRQIPAEEVLDLAKNLAERKGLLLERRA